MPKNRKKSGGMKTSTPPNPPKIPSATKLAIHSSEIAELDICPSQLKIKSIRSERGAETSYVKRKRAHQNVRKIGMPRYLFRKTLSSKSERVRGFSPLKTFCSILFMNS